jgi:hypothetical protein
MSYHFNQRLLFFLPRANFQSTSDQLFRKVGLFTEYRIKDIIAVQRSGGASVAVAGGVYTGAGKTGSALVGVGQSWLGLTGVNKMVVATLAGLTDTDVRTETPILSLTTGSVGAVTGDVYVYGQVLL